MSGREGYQQQQQQQKVRGQPPTHYGQKRSQHQQQGNRQQQQSQDRQQNKQPKKENILDLSKYIDTSLSLKFQGGRSVTGILKGFDTLTNLVLDNCIENLRDLTDNTKYSGESRELGLVVCRGTLITLISPTDGTEEIENPFIVDEELDE